MAAVAEALARDCGRVAERHLEVCRDDGVRRLVERNLGDVVQRHCSHPPYAVFFVEMSSTLMSITFLRRAFVGHVAATRPLLATIATRSPTSISFNSSRCFRVISNTFRLL